MTDEAVTQLLRLVIAFQEIEDRPTLRKLYANPLIVRTQTFEDAKEAEPGLAELLDGMRQDGYIVHDDDPMRARKRLREPIQPVNRAARRAGRKGDKRKGDTPGSSNRFGDLLRGV